MDEIKKYGLLEKQSVDDGEISLINRQALRTLAAEEVFTFRLAACDNRVDRDNERFTDEALGTLAKLFVGRTVLCDHKWAAAGQTARVYAAAVEDQGEGVKRLVLRCYMLRNEQSKAVIDAIEGGIMRECSVGCSVGKAVCSVCRTDKVRSACPHRPGAEYEGQKCHVDLDDAKDAYEVSFVAVPAQLAAGVVKAYGGEKNSDPTGEDPEIEKALALLELEYCRY